MIRRRRKNAFKRAYEQTKARPFRPRLIELNLQRKATPLSMESQGREKSNEKGTESDVKKHPTP